MNENRSSEYPSGSNILEAILHGLWLEGSDADYQRLVDVLNRDFGVIITVDMLRTIEQQEPVHPMLITMRRWPWMYAAKEECQKFSEMLREKAKQSGFNIREGK